MKRTLALLTVLLLLTMAAGAEEAVYFREIPQHTYFSSLLFTEESYPEVCLTTARAYSIFGSNPVSPLFVIFPGPDGALANDFDEESVHYLDPDNHIQYSYVVDASDSYEEFINKASQDEYILLDGSDKTAAYIDPSRSSAYGMIGVTEFGKSAKLRITIHLDSFGYQTPDELKVQPLSERILAEVARVKAAMRFEQKESFWTADAFAGIKMLRPNNEHCMVKIDFPKIAIGGVNPVVALTEVDDNSFDVYYYYGSGLNVMADVAVDTYSFCEAMLKEGKENCYKTVLPNGSEWIIYLSSLDQDGRSGYTHVSRQLNDPLLGSDPVYLTLLLDGEKVYWTEEELLGVLTAVDEAFMVMNAGDDPYVPQPKDEAPPAAEEAPAPAAQEEAGWFCPNCGHTGNTGNFCPECAAPRPWTCPNCGHTGNTGNFCPECAAPKP